MHANPAQPGNRLVRSAFTLVEMLVVIAIISILMTAGSIGLSSMGGKGVTSGVATVESLFDEARTTAVGRGLRACVLVAKELKNNPADDLRRVLVAYEETKADGTPVTPSDQKVAKWVLSSRGVLLPEQTFFSGKFSRAGRDEGSDEIEDIDHSSFVNAKKVYEGTYFIYQFNSQGICETPGASFIIGSGARNSSKPAGSNPPRVTGSAERDFGGFVVWRNGRTSVFRSPDQMPSGIKTIRSGEVF